MPAGSLLHGSPLQTLLVWVLGACIAAVVWYAVFYRAAHDEWVAASNELSAARSDLEQAHAAKLRADGRAVELDAEAASLARTRASVIVDEAGEDLLFTVPTLASRQGLQIDRWRPSPVEAEGALLRAPVQVDARGSWPAFAAFLTQLVTLPQILTLDRVTLRAAQGGTLELQFTISVVRLRGGE